MNRKIKKNRAIEYMILAYAAVLMLLIGPLGIFDGTREIAGSEAVHSFVKHRFPERREKRRNAVPPGIYTYKSRAVITRIPAVYTILSALTPP